MAQILPSRDAVMYRAASVIQGRRPSVDHGGSGRFGDGFGLCPDIPPLLNELTDKLKRQNQSPDIGFTLTPVGAYRAALDNENAARRDMRMAILLTTIGIAFLLIITFPRPLIGLLALIPSTAGAIFALLGLFVLLSFSVYPRGQFRRGDHGVHRRSGDRLSPVSRPAL